MTITGETHETEYTNTDGGEVKWDSGRGIEIPSPDISFDVVRVKVFRKSKSGQEEEVGRRDITVRKLMEEDAVLTATEDDVQQQQLKVTRWRSIHRAQGGSRRGIPSRPAGELNVGGTVWGIEDPEPEAEAGWADFATSDVLQAPSLSTKAPPAFATTILPADTATTPIMNTENEHMKALLNEPTMYTGAISVKVVGVAHLKSSWIKGRIKVRTKLEPGGWNTETSFKGKKRSNATTVSDGYTRVGEGKNLS